MALRAGAIDLLWSNLALQWVNDPLNAFAEFRRVLAPGGLLMFSTFGPDTLKELREAYRGTDAHTHVNRFVDLHDLGDMLVQSGFADPVMDMEHLTLTYTDVRALMRDLKAIGYTQEQAVEIVKNAANSTELPADISHRLETRAVVNGKPASNVISLSARLAMANAAR